MVRHGNTLNGRGKRRRTASNGGVPIESSVSLERDARRSSVEDFMNDAWLNLNNGVVFDTSSLSDTENWLASDDRPVSFNGFVPKSVRRHPTSIFPPGRHIVLPSVPVCWYCKAQIFFLEPDGFCCCAGDIVINPVVLPPDIVQLLTRTSDICEHFRTYIRVYNVNFAFTSMGAKNDKSLTNIGDCGIYTVRVSGQVHHFLGDLDGHSSSNLGLQLYFYDPENELQNRLATTPNLDQGVMEKIINAMEQNLDAAS